MPYRPHVPGRPPRADAPTTQISVRLTHEERAAVELHVQSTGMTRAELIRDAMERQGLFRPPG